MKDKTLFMIPGPTQVPESILHSTSRHPISHRSEEFSEVLSEVYANLRSIFRTKNSVFIYASSGTGAMCAAIENLINPNDKVLCLVIGKFGERWAEIAKHQGADVDILSVIPGDVIEPSMLESRLKKANYKAVTLTHSETSTGAANDIKRLCALIKQYGALSLVDGISSICAMECKMDDWGIDVLISGSQKGFMLPPGLSFLSASKEALEVSKSCLYKSFYFNFDLHQKAVMKNTTPFTPAISMIFGLQQSLRILISEGIEKINLKHQRHALALRKALESIGLELLVKEDKNASYAITAVCPPKNIDVSDITRIMKKDFDIVLANGQGELENKIFRIGTLGFVCDRDLYTTITALESTLKKLDFLSHCGKGLETLDKALSEKISQ